MMKKEMRKKWDGALPAGRCRIEAIQPNIIHCTYTLREEVLLTSSLNIVKGEVCEIHVCELEEQVYLAAPELRLRIDKATGRFTWQDREGGLLFQELGKELLEVPFLNYVINGNRPIIRREKTVDGERNFVENLVPLTDHTAYRAKLYLSFQEGEGIYGLGQGEEGIFNYRGQVQYLYQHNMRIPIPFFISSKGYAVLIDCGCLLTFQEDQRVCCLHLDSVEQLDYYVIYGKEIDQLIAGFRTLTGRAAMLPKWAFGYIQSKEAYHTQKELIEVAERYRREALPLDCVVQDWNTWEEGAWGNKQVDKLRYPNLAEMNEYLHKLHVHSMVSIWPTMNSGTPNHREMMEKNLLLKDYTTYDAFSEEAREVYWKQMKEELFSGGFDAWWCDSTEPFSGPDWNGEEKREPWERFCLVGKEHKKYLGADRANLYAVAHARGIYEHQRAEKTTKRVVNLTRSGYPSIQKYGTILWSGDICATWDTLKRQITEGINMGLSGMPYWTLDIGGFFTVYKNWRRRGCFCQNDSAMKWFWRGDYEEGVEDLGYRELYVRWFQYAAFLPLFRAHGTDTPRELWQFGAKGDPFYDALVKSLRLRYRLMPYIYSCAGSVWREHSTMVRGLMFDYPQDKSVWEISDEYMFGKNLLVCPVTEPMYYEKNSQRLEKSKERSCYLPKGSLWYDYETGKQYTGGTWILRETPLGQIPLFIKAGTILPMEHGLQYAQECVGTPFELHIYGGADGALSYYEDCGEGYGYETGDYQVIEMTWEEEKRLLTIGAARTQYPQSIVGRSCVAIFQTQRREFVYTGEKMQIYLQ